MAVSLSVVNSKNSEDLKGGETVNMRITGVTHEDIDCPHFGFFGVRQISASSDRQNTLPLTNENPHLLRVGERIQAEFTFKLHMLPNEDYAVMTSFADGDL
jgi:lipopolysaccharide transport system ATP-binding protein